MEKVLCTGGRSCTGRVPETETVHYAPGDVIYQGEIIGYTGKTGNCYDIPNYHLHLVVVDYEKRNAGNGKYLNPEDYINGNVDWTDDNKRTLESLNIINIDCHDENENAKYF